MTRDTDLIRRALVEHSRDLLLDQASKAMPDSGDEELDHGHRMYRAGIRDLARRLMLAPAKPGKEVRDVHDRVEPPSPGVTAGATGPERIWAWSWLTQPMGQWSVQPSRGAVEYIRADLATPAPVQEPPGPGVTAGAAGLGGCGYPCGYDCNGACFATPAPVVPAEGPISTLEMVYRNMPDIPELPEAYQPRNIARSLAALRSAPPVGARVTVQEAARVLLTDRAAIVRMVETAEDIYATGVSFNVIVGDALRALLPAGEG